MLINMEVTNFLIVACTITNDSKYGLPFHKKCNKNQIHTSQCMFSSLCQSKKYEDKDKR